MKEKILVPILIVAVLILGGIFITISIFQGNSINKSIEDIYGGGGGPLNPQPASNAIDFDEIVNNATLDANWVVSGGAFNMTLPNTSFSEDAWFDGTVSVSDDVLVGGVSIAGAGGVSQHGLLNSDVHTDVLTASVSQGSLIYGNATPKWAELDKGASNSMLFSDSSGIHWDNDLFVDGTASISGSSLGNSAFDAVLSVTNTSMVAEDDAAIYGKNTGVDGNGYGIRGDGGYIGVWGQVDRTGSEDGYGFYSATQGIEGASGGIYGLYSLAYGTTTGDVFGVFADAGATGAGAAIAYGLWAEATGGTTNYAGYFGAGNVFITNNLVASGSANLDNTTSISGSLYVGSLISCDTIDTDANGLMSCGTDNAGGGATTHDLMNADVHTDVTNASASQGSLIYGQAADNWQELTIGTNDFVLQSDGTDLAWANIEEVVSDNIDFEEIVDAPTLDSDWTISGDYYIGHTRASISEALTVSSSEDGANVVTIRNTTDDLTIDTNLLTLEFEDNNDANMRFIQCIDDSAGTPDTVFYVDNTGNLLTTGAVEIGDETHDSITVNGTSKAIQLGVHGGDTANEYVSYMDRASDTHSPTFVIARARGDHGSFATVENGDILGQIGFMGYDGTDWAIGSQIKSIVDGAPSDGTDMPSELIFRTTADGAGTPVDRLYIKSDGAIVSSGSWEVDSTVSASGAFTLSDDAIQEEAIDFNTACAAGNHYYLSGDDLACEADDDTTYTVVGDPLGITGTVIDIDYASASQPGYITGTDWDTFNAKLDAGADGIYASDSLDFDEFVDAMTLDATTSVSFGAYDYIFNLDSTGDFNIQDDGTSAFFVRDDGNVGIGDTDPGYKLSVDGTASISDSLFVLDDVLTVSQSFVGINTTDPGALLAIQDDDSSDWLFAVSSTSTANYFGVASTGYVGIGTTDPSYKLQVVDTIALGTGAGTLGGDNNLIRPGATSAWLNLKGGAGSGYISLGNEDIYITGGSSNGKVNLGSNGTSNQVVLAGGNVGIGTESPDSKLDVAGHLIASSSYFGGYVSISGGDLSVASSGYASGDDYGPPFYVDVDNERVGIGTTGPNYKLSVQGSGAFLGTINDDIRFKPEDDTLSSVYGTTIRSYNGGYGAIDISKGVYITYNAKDKSGTNDFTIAHGSGQTTVMTIEGGDDIGNVGIGDSSPDYKLSVDGTASVSGQLYLDTIGASELLYGSAASTIGAIASGTEDYVLTMVGGVPAWAVNSGGTPYTATEPLSLVGSAFDIDLASTSGGGYLSSTDWDLFDAKLDINDGLDSFGDVVTSSVADNEILSYEDSSSNWINQTRTELGLLYGGGTLTDTQICVADGTSGAIDCNIAQTYYVADGCSDCLNATEIEDIYFLTAGDTASASVLTIASADVTSASFGTIYGTVTLATGVDIVVGAVTWSYTDDKIDGEQIYNDTIDNDSIDWGDMTDLGTDGVVTWTNLTEGELTDQVIVGADIKNDSVDSDDYNADSIDNEHINWADFTYLDDDGAVDVAAYAAVGTFTSGDTFVCLEAGVGIRECDYDDLPGGMTSFYLEDDDGTEVTISDTKEVKFIDSTGLTINWTDTSTGSDADPYDLTFTIVPDDIAGAISAGALTNNSIIDADLDDDGAFTLTGAWTFNTAITTINHASVSEDLSINDVHVVPWGYECHTIASISDTDDDLGFSIAAAAMTVTNVYCSVEDGTSAVITLGDGTNKFEAITCDDDGATDDGSITNATFTAQEQIRFDTGTVTGVVRSCTICIKYEYD